MVARKQQVVAALLLLALCSLNLASACYFARQGGFQPAIDGQQVSVQSVYACAPLGPPAAAAAGLFPTPSAQPPLASSANTSG